MQKPVQNLLLNYTTFLTKLLRAKRSCPYHEAESSSVEAVRKLNNESFQSEDPLNEEFETVAVLNSISGHIHYLMWLTGRCCLTCKERWFCIYCGGEQ